MTPEGHREDSRRGPGRQVRRWSFRFLGLLLFAAIVYWGGRRALLQVAHPRPGPLAFGLVATGGALMASSGRWAYATNRYAGQRVIGYLDAFVYLMSGTLVGAISSQSVGTVVVRSAALNRLQKLSVSRSLSSVVIDKSLDLFYITIFAVPAVVFLADWIDLSQALVGSALLFVTSTGLVVLLNQRLLAPLVELVQGILWLLVRIPLLNRRLTTIGSRLTQQVKDLEAVMTPHGLLILCLCSLVKQVLLAMRLYFIALAVDVSDVSLGLLFLGLPFAQLSLLLAFTPGALGVLELGWYGVLAAAGLTRDTAVSFVIGQRVYNFLFLAALTLLSYLLIAARQVVQKPFWQRS